MALMECLQSGKWRVLQKVLPSWVVAQYFPHEHQCVVFANPTGGPHGVLVMPDWHFYHQVLLPAPWQGVWGRWVSLCWRATWVFQISTMATLLCCDMYVDFAILLLVVVVDSYIRFSAGTVVWHFVHSFFLVSRRIVTSFDHPIRLSRIGSGQR